MIQLETIDNKVNVTKCKECGSGDIVYDDVGGEIVCKQCGFVISSNIIDPSPEWSAYNEKQRLERSRIGSPLTWTIYDRGLSTTIKKRKYDYLGHKLGSNKIHQLNRIIRWNRRSKVSDSSETNLIFALAEMSKIAYKLRLPRIVLETASLNYRQCLKQNLTRGRSIKGVALASLYIACRQCGSVHSLDDISKVTQFSKKDLAKVYRFVIKKMHTKVPQTDPIKYVSMLLNHLKLHGETEQVASKILKRVKELGLTRGRNPRAIAAAVIYIAAILTNEKKTQAQIANELHVTEVTIRNRYKELKTKLDIKLNL